MFALHQKSGKSQVLSFYIPVWGFQVAISEEHGGCTIEHGAAESVEKAGHSLRSGMLQRHVRSGADEGRLPRRLHDRLWHLFVTARPARRRVRYHVRDATERALHRERSARCVLLLLHFAHPTACTPILRAEQAFQ